MLNKFFRYLKLLYFNWGLLYKIFETYSFYYLQKTIGLLKKIPKLGVWYNDCKVVLSKCMFDYTNEFINHEVSFGLQINCFTLMFCY